MDTKKQKAIDRAALLLSNRAFHASASQDFSLVSVESIKLLLEQEFSDVHEAEEDDGR